MPGPRPRHGRGGRWRGGARGELGRGRWSPEGAAAALGRSGGLCCDRGGRFSRGSPGPGGGAGGGSPAPALGCAGGPAGSRAAGEVARRPGPAQGVSPAHRRGDGSLFSLNFIFIFYIVSYFGGSPRAIDPLARPGHSS